MKFGIFMAALIAALVVISVPAFARGGGSHGYSSGSSGGSHGIRGYTRKDGTYVAPHQQTNPNSTMRDNWSTKGNVNPYSGKEGTKDAVK